MENYVRWFKKVIDGDKLGEEFELKCLMKFEYGVEEFIKYFI